MKQDIRELFKEDDFEGKKLPKNHKEEFAEKLKNSNLDKPKKFKLGFIFKAVATVALVLSLGYYALNKNVAPVNKLTPLELQVQQIEKEYLQEIDNEWNNFLKVTNDQKLIKKYREKLDNLDSNYKKLSKSFKESPNNITVLENLIKNLQTRLQLLKDIQNHIQTLNTQQKTYETIIL